MLQRAGAKGRHFEVGHSLRHGARDLMSDEDIEEEASRLQMGHELGDVHDRFGRRAEFRRAECAALAHMALPAGIEWSVFRGLDFERISKNPRPYTNGRECGPLVPVADFREISDFG
ncbi:hypothetical protein [Blastochloris sulfoviridis]|uniref:Phage integrase family protein n=1 Tax=Blastochloris sulfoviridis TaxID=50712 RepID=A0A5M6I2H0_9HYPH|nr:hypothetical protein [Blastochloris sulfoviridis]KAA5601978.1 hypothetical protein F1193_07455 [Blastochloris sulfoviridis]